MEVAQRRRRSRVAWELSKTASDPAPGAAGRAKLCGFQGRNPESEILPRPDLPLALGANETGSSNQPVDQLFGPIPRSCCQVSLPALVHRLTMPQEAESETTVPSKTW